MFRTNALEYKQIEVYLRDSSHLRITYTDTTTGQDIFDKTLKAIYLPDKEYYCLKFNHQRLVDLRRPIAKQIKSQEDRKITLSFKFYPADPTFLSHNTTRSKLCNQLISDLRFGNLAKGVKEDSLVFLSACILRLDPNAFPDFMESDGDGVIFNIIQDKSNEFTSHAIQVYREHCLYDLSEDEVATRFLEAAKRLDYYGIYKCPYKDNTHSLDLEIGVNFNGIAIFDGSGVVDQRLWHEIDRIAYENKLLLVYCYKREDKYEVNYKKTVLFAYKLSTRKDAQWFWKIANEHRFFFTLESQPESPIITRSGGFFKTHKLKYDGRVERDILRDQDLDSYQSSVVDHRYRSFIAKFETLSEHSDTPDSLSDSHDCTWSPLPPINSGSSRQEDEKGDKTDCVEDLTQSMTKQDDPLSAKKRNSKCSTTRNTSKTSLRQSSPSLAKHETQFHHSKVSNVTIRNDDDFIKSTLIMVFIISLILTLLFFLYDSKQLALVNSVAKRLNLGGIKPAVKFEHYDSSNSALSNFFAQLLPS